MAVLRLAIQLSLRMRRAVPLRCILLVPAVWAGSAHARSGQALFIDASGSVGIGAPSSSGGLGIDVSRRGAAMRLNVVRYARLVAVRIEAVKEARAEALERRVDALEASARAASSTRRSETVRRATARSGR